MRKKITMEDLAALTRTEAEILALPGTEQSYDFTPLAFSPEYKAKLENAVPEDGEHQMVLVIRNCEGIGGYCQHHADEILGHIFIDRSLPVEDRDPCPNGCGKSLVDCWKIVAFREDFLMRFGEFGD